MKTRLTLLICLLLVGIKGFSQDRIIKTTNDTLKCYITEVGEDEVKYKLENHRNDLLFSIDKNKIREIIFSDGKSMKIVDSMKDPSSYANQRKNAIKIGFLSPLTGSTNISYERSMGVGKSIEATLGIVGLGEPVYEMRDARGVYLKAGYKFMRTPDFYLKGMRYAHILKGSYVKPELSFSSYSFIQEAYYGMVSNSNPYRSDVRHKNTMMAITINFGKQWIMNDLFLIDWYTGIGYGFGNNPDGDAYHYAFSGADGDTPLVITAGLKIGLLFR